MKINRLLEFPCQDQGETSATFGNARLVRKLNGKVELIGGSPADRGDAKEWCSLFLHAATFACVP